MGIFTRETEPHPGSMEVFDDREASDLQSLSCTKSMDTNKSDTFTSDEMMKRRLQMESGLLVSNVNNMEATHTDTSHTSQQPDATNMTLGLQYSIPLSDNGYAKAGTESSTEITGIDGKISTCSRHRVGRWTLDEKLLFLFGLQKFGKGRWKKISLYLPNRSLVQIKSHAQKVLKRIEMGENVFRRLEENCARLNILVSEIHQTFGLDQAPIVVPATANKLMNKTKTSSKRSSIHGSASQPSDTGYFSNDTLNLLSDQTESMSSEGSEHILAASALCQLALPDECMDQNGAKMVWRQHHYGEN